VGIAPRLLDRPPAFTRPLLNPADKLVGVALLDLKAVVRQVPRSILRLAPQRVPLTLFEIGHGR
jgi:hypothetical protein